MVDKAMWEITTNDHCIALLQTMQQHRLQMAFPLKRWKRMRDWWAMLCITTPIQPGMVEHSLLKIFSSKKSREVRVDLISVALKFHNCIPKMVLGGWGVAK